MGRRPDFLIIGAMKCGTSTLHEQLAAQPGFFMSTPKEPFYFSDDPVFEQGIDWYESLFAGATDDQQCGESSTHYAKQPCHPDAPARAADCVPDAKLIYVVRDPLDRIVSQYIHEWSVGKVSVPLGPALEQHPELVHYSRYAWQLEHWLPYYPRERVHVVLFEDMVREPDRVFAEVLAFLGGCGAWVHDVPQQNVSRERMRTNKLRDLVVEAPGLAWIRRTLVPQSVRDRIKGLWQMRERPELTAEQATSLAERLRPDVEGLADWTDLDRCLARWDRYRTALERTGG